MNENELFNVDAFRYLEEVLFLQRFNSTVLCRLVKGEYTPARPTTMRQEGKNRVRIMEWRRKKSLEQ